VVVRTKAQCRDDPDLEAFLVEDGPAAEQCESIRANLCSGEAKEQTVVMLKEEGSSQVLSLISVWPGGRPEWAAPFWQGPAWVKQLARTTAYVGLLARDTRLEGSVLADGETPLGFATVRAGLEFAISPGSSTPVPLWAVTERSNDRAHRALGHGGFHRDSRSSEWTADVLVRRGGRRLREAPPLSAYRPLRPLPGYEYPLA